MDSIQKLALEAQVASVGLEHGHSAQMDRLCRSLKLDITTSVSQEALLNAVQEKTKELWHQGLIQANKAYAKIMGQAEELEKQIKEAEEKHNSDGLPIDSKLAAKVAAVAAAATALVALCAVGKKVGKAKAEQRKQDAAPVTETPTKEDRLDTYRDKIEDLKKEIKEAKKTFQEKSYQNGALDREGYDRVNRLTGRLKGLQSAMNRLNNA